MGVQDEALKLYPAWRYLPFMLSRKERKSSRRRWNKKNTVIKKNKKNKQTKILQINNSKTLISGR